MWRVLRRQGISLRRRRSWCISTDPAFAPKAADILGLYLQPPENALVLAVDEKPSIQALERAQGWIRLPNGKALTGFNHCYTRHGTTTLFAALDVASGQVKTGHYSRRRRREFLDFMNEVVAEHPDCELHVVLDNLNTHKPKTDGWLRRHPRVHFHYTPTYASWLNQVECWFSLLTRQALQGASFTSPRELRQAIDQFVTLCCISNPVGGDLIGTTRWSGVALQQLLARIDVMPRATHLEIVSADGFSEVVAIDTIHADARIMLAYAWDGLPLARPHGFPLRLYVPDRYGMKQPKWIASIEAIDRWKPGYWVARGKTPARASRSRSATPVHLVVPIRSPPTGLDTQQSVTN